MFFSSYFIGRIYRCSPRSRAIWQYKGIPILNLCAALDKKINVKNGGKICSRNHCSCMFLFSLGGCFLVQNYKYNPRKTINLIIVFFFCLLFFLVVNEQGNKSDQESTKSLEKYDYEIPRRSWNCKDDRSFTG
jgi:hypothetical protein